MRTKNLQIFTILIASSWAFTCLSPNEARAEKWSGTNVYASAYSLPCTVDINRDHSGQIERVTVSGTAKRVNYWSEPKSEIAASLVTIGETVTSPELHSMVSFASAPSLAHLGYTRIGLQILTGNWDHPWPGFQDVRYVVKSGDFNEVIAKSELYMMIRAIPLGYDEIHCQDLQQDSL